SLHGQQRRPAHTAEAIRPRIFIPTPRAAHDLSFSILYDNYRANAGPVPLLAIAKLVPSSQIMLPNFGYVTTRPSHCLGIARRGKLSPSWRSPSGKAWTRARRFPSSSSPFVLPHSSPS